MVKVITYGTYDHIHHGHIRLLQRAKALGDYLIVGVTSDDFDKSRGKINVQQNLEERISALQATGIPDKIIIEEYEGQKIDDIRRYGVDIFTVGSDWVGFFDYLKEYCQVVYLPRTEGISSSEIRTSKTGIKLGLVGYSSFLNKFYRESKCVNAVDVVGICSSDVSMLGEITREIGFVTNDFEELLARVDAVYIHSHPEQHYEQCRIALSKGKHVLCESPVAESEDQCRELIEMAKQNGCVLMEGIRTAYLTAYSRLLLLLKGGKIGRVVSVDATCTSLSTYGNFSENSVKWGAMEAWGPTALLPVFQILGTDVKDVSVFSVQSEEAPGIDGFTKLGITYDNAAASVNVGLNVKSESDLVISGTKGYAYVPSPWWKTDYFELRYEDASENKRYFYQVDGEGIRYELVQLVSAINNGRPDFYINRTITEAISKMMNTFRNKTMN